MRAMPRWYIEEVSIEEIENGLHIHDEYFKEENTELSQNVNLWKGGEYILTYDDFYKITTQCHLSNTQLKPHGVIYTYNTIFRIYTKTQIENAIKKADDQLKELLKQKYTPVQKTLYVDYFISHPLYITFDQTAAYVQHEDGWCFE